MDFTFQKQEKLKHKKLIEMLFTEGKSISLFPLRIVYLQIEHNGGMPLQIGFSVPKRNIKKAVDRNRVKRQLREAYRLNKNEIYNSIDKKFIMMVIFMGNKKMNSQFIKSGMIKVLQKFVKSVS